MRDPSAPQVKTKMLANRNLRLCSTVATIASFFSICGCQGLKQSANFNPALQPINHIVVMVQENRSLDSYLGKLPDYWAANGYPTQQFEGLPAGASNPAYNGTTIPDNTKVNTFHLATECIDNLSPSWNESHEDWNLQSPTSSTPTLDGFVYNAAKYAIDVNSAGATPAFTDTQGLRAMGYYDWTDLNYYYFMASNFATSDYWFAPVLDRTQVNRLYLFAATSQGYAYPPGTTTTDNAALDAPTIFDSLNNGAVSWKIYATDDTCSSVAPDSKARAGAVASAASTGTGFCTYLTQFKNYATPNALPPNVVSVSDFVVDADAGNLPAVSFIEPGYLSHQDEHPASDTNIQIGAAYVQGLISHVMNGPSWNDTAFILTYDEPGGAYDHIAPQATVSPDGISPVDLASTDICAASGDTSNPLCNFEYTGYRVPLIVISPFAKKNYVSHTVADYTAILKFIEARYGLPSLTQRDAAQIDMSEFFDFTTIPWATLPSNIPQQVTTGACDSTKLQ